MTDELLSFETIMDQRFRPRELYKQPSRIDWVSRYSDLAMEHVFGNKVYPFDHQGFTTRLREANVDVIKAFRKLQGLRVPAYIAGAGVSEEEAAKFFASNNSRGNIVIVSRVDQGELDAAVSAFCEQFEEDHRADKSLRLTHEDIEAFDKSFRQSECFGKEIVGYLIDYANYRDNYINLCKLQATCDTNSGHGPAILKELLRAFVAVGDQPKRMFIGIISDNNGRHTETTGHHDAGEWKGQLGGRLHRDMILVEEDLWALVGPPGVSWVDYQNKMLRIFEKGFEWQAKTDGERAFILQTERDDKRAEERRLAEARSLEAERIRQEEARLTAELENEKARFEAEQTLIGVSPEICARVQARLNTPSDLTITADLKRVFPSLTIPIVKAIRRLAQE